MSGTSVGAQTPFQVRKYADVALELIRQMILDGEFEPGERLNEIALSERLQISRPPIREALQALSGEGLVRMVPGKGGVVASFDLESVQQLGEVRIALECAAARLAADRASERQLDDLRRILRSTEEALREPSQPYPRDLDFHVLLLDAAGNPYLAQTAREISTQMRLARVRSGQSPERALQALAEHKAILAALENQDADGAAAAMRDHLMSSLAHIAQLLSDSAGGSKAATEGDTQ